MSRSLSSKLPDVGTTIFTVMSQLAHDTDAINLAQGFPSFEPPKSLTDRISYHLNHGANQYAPMTGIPALRQAIAEKTERLQGRAVDVDAEITVCTGATEGLFSAIQAVVHAGDEVIVLDPAYDSYEPAVTLAGGVTRHVPLLIDDDGHDFSIDWQCLKDTINAKGEPHRSLLSHDELWERTLVVASFGKTFHATGWKLGYCIAPAPLSVEFRKVHQFTTFAVSTPMQHGVADFLVSDPDFYADLPAFYQQKRDHFCRLLEGSRFRFRPARSTFFQILDYGDVSDDDDLSLAKRWTREIGVASIPLSVFCETPFTGTRLRFCFAKDHATLEDAARRLHDL
jgi:methionine aminotransferase